VGNFDDQYRKPAGEDRDLNIKLAKVGARLRLDKSILVYHDRDLTLTSFTKKHYNYGKAAYKIYARYPELKSLTLASYIDMYLSILRNYSSFKEKSLAFLLLTISQIATILGYHSAVFSP
jgi:GT2 family glycosyltransferase